MNALQIIFCHMTCLKVSQQAWLIKSNVEIKCRQTDQIKELLSQIKEMPQLSVRQKYCVCLSYVGHPQSKKCECLGTWADTPDASRATVFTSLSETNTISRGSEWG